jgi:hypothetical protein
MGLHMFISLCINWTSIHIMKLCIDTWIRDGRCELQCVTATERLLAVRVLFMVHISVTSTYVISFLSIFVQPNRKTHLTAKLRKAIYNSWSIICPRYLMWDIFKKNFGKDFCKYLSCCGLYRNLLQIYIAVRKPQFSNRNIQTTFNAVFSKNPPFSSPSTKMGRWHSVTMTFYCKLYECACLCGCETKGCRKLTVNRQH